MVSSSHRATALVQLLVVCCCCLFHCYGVNGLSTPPPSIQQTPPPSNNPDVLRSYVLGEDGGARCWELLTPSVAATDPDEDEVEYWYPTRKRHFEFSIPAAATKPAPAGVTIRQTSFGCGKLGSEVWDSSVVLCLYLGEQGLVGGKRILELGSGCGLPSVVCRDELGAAAVLATDFWENDTDGFDGDRLVPTKFHGLNLEHNVVVKKSSNDEAAAAAAETSVQKLDWHDRASATSARETFRPDLVIGSDLVYYPMDVEPLLGALGVLLVGGSDGGDGSGTSTSKNNKQHTRAVLVLPLAPAEREALPEFRSKLPDRFSKTHTVAMEEKYLFQEDTDGENSTYLVIDIVPK